MDIRDKIIEEALSWQNTPWHHMGEVKGAGVDCAQFVKNVYVNVGLVEWFDTGYYPQDWMMHKEEERFLGIVERYAKQVHRPEKGDIVVYKVGRCFSHGGIVIQWPLIIHAFQPEYSVVQAYGDQGFLRGKLTKFYSVLS